MSSVSHNDVESPFHRALDLDFRRSTVLPSAAMHGNVECVPQCHEIEKHQLVTSEWHLGSTPSQAEPPYPFAGLCCHEIDETWESRKCNGIDRRDRKYMQDVKYTRKIRCSYIVKSNLVVPNPIPPA